MLRRLRPCHAASGSRPSATMPSHEAKKRVGREGEEMAVPSHGSIETHGETPSQGYLEDYPWLGSEEMVIREDHPTDKWWIAMVSPSTRVIPFHLLNGMILPLVNDPRYRSSNGLSSSFNTSCCTSGSPVVHTSYFSGRMTGWPGPNNVGAYAWVSRKMRAEKLHRPWSFSWDGEKAWQKS